MITALFNGILLAVGVAVVVRARRAGRVRIGDLLGAVVLAGVLAVLLGEDAFGVMRLLCDAIFVQGVALFVGLAAVLWRPARRSAVVFAGLAAVGAGIGVDAFFIEPATLEVSRVVVESERAPRALRIVVVADLQLEAFGEHERRALATAMAERPDMLVLPGDYIQQWEGPAYEAARSELNAYMREIGFAAPLGAFAVPGNVDGRGWTRIFEGVPVTVFASTRTEVKDGIAVTGLDLAGSFDTRAKVERAAPFHVVVGHAPDFSLGEVEADLLIAGHTHGGQVQLPLIGPLITLSQVPRAWAAGVTALDGGRTLVVSRGIGMERGYAPRLRFLCRPEIVVIDVVPARP